MGVTFSETARTKLASLPEDTPPIEQLLKEKIAVLDVLQIEKRYISGQGLWNYLGSLSLSETKYFEIFLLPCLF